MANTPISLPLTGTSSMPGWKLTARSLRADEIVNAIMDAGHTRLAGHGIVAVLPVEKVCRIRSKTEGNAHDI
jgi:nitrogen regulatory protein PII